MFVTITEGEVAPEREKDLLAAWEDRTAPALLPGGFIESSLLRGEDHRWQIVTVWESREAVLAMRASGEQPAGPAMFERAGSRPSVSMWTVEGRVTAP